jgi:hypothetical protein
MSNGAERPDFSVLERTGAGPRRPSGFAALLVGAGFAADWIADRIEDAAAWLSTLVRYLPVRVLRFCVTLAVGLFALLRFPPAAIRSARRGRSQVRTFVTASRRRGALRAIQFLFETLDLLGIPEIFAFVWRILTRTSPLTGAEIEAAASVLGQWAVRYQDVRIAQGGVLRWIFARNGQRAFALFHTINLPEHGAHRRDRIDIVVHEIIHVYQYERAGSRYVAEALLGQREAGYDYGGPEGLKAAHGEGVSLKRFNREQQAQIAQDYLLAVRARSDLSAYEPFIRQLREGRL